MSGLEPRPVGAPDPRVDGRAAMVDVRPAPMPIIGDAVEPLPLPVAPLPPLDHAHVKERRESGAMGLDELERALKERTDGI